ncbi:hypothetical protein BD779DRAFT_1676285 [Infundibulicybe gibba]|nr:hypothetical protein BD779DRAFT_1676285 [Infundibulicybe gibba]
MSPKEWPTDAQSKLLHSFLDEFRGLTSKRQYGPFWAKINEAWFTTYPERASLFPDNLDGELSPDDQARLSRRLKTGMWYQLQTWYRWRSSKRGRVAEKKQGVLLKSLTTNKTRAHHLSEIYIRLYYEERIKGPALKECEENNITSRGGILVVVNKWARQLYSQEDEETKAIVEGERLKEIEDMKKSMDESSDRTPEQYMSAIHDCPGVVGRFFEALARETGWSFSCIMGGPNPEKDGNITVGSGTNDLGNCFGLAHPNYNEVYMQPFTDFLDQIYPLSTRRSRALDLSLDADGDSDKDVKEPGIQIAPVEDVRNTTTVDGPGGAHSTDQVSSDAPESKSGLEEAPIVPPSERSNKSNASPGSSSSPLPTVGMTPVSGDSPGHASVSPAPKRTSTPVVHNLDDALPAPQPTSPLVSHYSLNDASLPQSSGFQLQVLPNGAVVPHPPSLMVPPADGSVLPQALGALGSQSLVSGVNPCMGWPPHVPNLFPTNAQGSGGLGDPWPHFTLDPGLEPSLSPVITGSNSMFGSRSGHCGEAIARHLVASS